MILKIYCDSCFLKISIKGKAQNPPLTQTTKTQIRYAVKKKELKPERIIGNSKFWNPKNLKPVVAQKPNIEIEAYKAVAKEKECQVPLG